MPVVRPRSLNTPDGSDPQLSCRAPQLNHTVDKLDNGTEYMFRVFAKFGDGDMSRPSDEVKAMPMVPTPALPVFGAAGPVAAGRRRLRARRLLQERQRRLLKA